MTCFNDLPREVQLLVLSKLDMDGRVNCGIIHKLSVSKSLSDAISNACLKEQTTIYKLAYLIKSNMDSSTLKHVDIVK